LQSPALCRPPQDTPRACRAGRPLVGAGFAEDEAGLQLLSAAPVIAELVIHQGKAYCTGIG